MHCIYIPNYNPISRVQPRHGIACCGQKKPRFPATYLTLNIYLYQSILNISNLIFLSSFSQFSVNTQIHPAHQCTSWPWSLCLVLAGCDPGRGPRQGREIQGYQPPSSTPLYHPGQSPRQRLLLRRHLIILH